MERESMAFDVIIVGAGAAGLSAACRLMQLANEQNHELSVCVVEKGAEVGAHILSGAVFETTALDELFPNWAQEESPLNTPVQHDDVYFLPDQNKSYKIPHPLVPNTMKNEGNYVVSMGNVCRWLAEKATNLGVEIFPGFAGADILYGDDGSVAGIITGDMGIAADGTQKENYMPGMALKAKYTLFAEGCRGHLGKQLISHYALDKDVMPQHYGIGFKEIWDIDPALHQPGRVIHTVGWPLSEASGGGYLYHAENNQVFVGLIIDLNYANPTLSPFDEFQRMKHHPIFARFLTGAKRVSYGARAIAKGGLMSLPKMAFPGGLLIGCDAGTLNFAKIKGNHTAMKSGLIAAQSVFEAIIKGEAGTLLSSYEQDFKSSWLYKELDSTKNFGAAIHKFGTIVGGAFNTIEQNLLRGNPLFTLKDKQPDHAQLKALKQIQTITYPKPDGVLSFDKLSSVYLSNTHHDDDQPCHLQLADENIPLAVNLPMFDEPAQRYCPAGVYEIIEEEGIKRFQINAQNCIHCKTCDIKDPAQNITWTVPEGGGGPTYPNM